MPRISAGTGFAASSVTTPDGGAESCANACSPGEYALSCYGTGPGAIPAPEAALRCSVIGVPTPSNALFYCCRCVP